MEFSRRNEFNRRPPDLFQWKSMTQKSLLNVRSQANLGREQNRQLFLTSMTYDSTHWCPYSPVASVPWHSELTAFQNVGHCGLQPQDLHTRALIGVIRWQGMTRHDFWMWQVTKPESQMLFITTSPLALNNKQLGTLLWIWLIWGMVHHFSMGARTIQAVEFFHHQHTWIPLLNWTHIFHWLMGEKSCSSSGVVSVWTLPHATFSALFESRVEAIPSAFRFWFENT